MLCLTKVLLSSDIFGNSHGIYFTLASGSADGVGELLPLCLETSANPLCRFLEVSFAQV